VNAEPVYTLGAIFTSLKVAVVSVLTVVALALQLDEAMTAAVIGAGSAIIVVVGDVLGYVLTRERVTSVANPNLPLGTEVNRANGDPTGVVVAAQPR
jgi:hypothetical protein